MSNQLKNRELRRRLSVSALILTMALSAGAFGCTTNHVQSAREPATTPMAGGSAASRAVITPATAGAPPMISAAVDPSVDAIAVLEASRGFQGRVLGPAAPGSNSAGIPQQYATGQFVPPAVHSGSLVASATAAPVQPGTTVAGNFGVTGVSNATATGIAGGAMPPANIAGGTNLVVGTGIAAAPATASSVLATPTLGTSARLNVNNPAAVGTGAATGVRLETSPTGGTVVTNSKP